MIHLFYLEIIRNNKRNEISIFHLLDMYVASMIAIDVKL